MPKGSENMIDKERIGKAFANAPKDKNFSRWIRDTAYEYGIDIKEGNNSVAGFGTAMCATLSNIFVEELTLSDISEIIKCVPQLEELMIEENRKEFGNKYYDKGYIHLGYEDGKDILISVSEPTGLMKMNRTLKD